ncbi:MAG: T9SS type A sorting domain-containing protein [Bacteroidaceae bacterium]|nr:T9SS type A sorting domain-containing protein [Bacteroidaceae bacterium]
MKRTILLLLILIYAATTWAQSDTQWLVVWQKSGEKTYIELTDEPVTTFEDMQLVIRTSRTTAAFPLEDVLRYTFEGVMTAINAPKLKTGEIVFRQHAADMTFDGLADGTEVSLYSMDGKLLHTQSARSSLQTVVSLAGYPSGTYIVKVGHATYKFMKR